MTKFEDDEDCTVGSDAMTPEESWELFARNMTREKFERTCRMAIHFMLDGCLRICKQEQEYWRERDAPGLFAAENIEYAIQKMKDGLPK